MDPSVTYRFAHGFSCRRENFGGILFHYEGIAPDPRLTFVDSAFLIDLLQMVEEAPMGQLMEEASGHFKLKPDQHEVMHRFLADLVEKEALVPK